MRRSSFRPVQDYVSRGPQDYIFVKSWLTKGWLFWAGLVTVYVGTQIVPGTADLVGMVLNDAAARNDPRTYGVLGLHLAWLVAGVIGVVILLSMFREPRKPSIFKEPPRPECEQQGGDDSAPRDR